jgi:outer membrane protein insertion porin family
LIRIRAALLALAFMLPALAWSVDVAAQSAQRQPPAARPQRATPVATGDVIQSIRIDGTQRIENGTVLSYMLLTPGDRFDSERIASSIKTLYSTGLFQDVNIRRDGSVLVVKVIENPIVNRIAFEGNKKISDEALRAELILKPRAVFTPALAAVDRQKILDMYAKKGRFDTRVDTKIIRLDQNRVDVVFEVFDGDVTLISRIAFVGNAEFSSSRLGEIVGTREQRWWRILSSSDTYDPERLSFDKELLRRFYLKNGYIDFEVTDAKAELSPDRTAFFVTYTLREGERFRVTKVTVDSKLRKLSGDDLSGIVSISDGDWYNADQITRDSDALSAEVRARGIAFVEVKPRVIRNKDGKSIDLVFEVGEGPRVFIERIDISGNVRTQDKVIRREMRVAEGDALNPEAVRLSRQRLIDLRYFGAVDIQPAPGSAEDKAILNTTVEEKATGELTFGGGYSTDAGALIDVGLQERNLVGTGISAGINGILAQRRSSIDLNVTDPYFLDRNLVAGVNIFYITTNNQETAQYNERRAGFALNLGYRFNENLSQAWSYSFVNRDVFNIAPNASFYIQDQAGQTALSQLGQVFSVDYRDSRIAPHAGFITRLGTDFAGIGGDAKFFRTKLDGTYYIPLDRFTNNTDWGIAISGGIGYFFYLGQQEQIIDRFFLGGENLRGFQVGGVGPHDVNTGDSLGGRFLWTQSTELRFPLPLPADLGVSGRIFADIGSLSQGSFESNNCPTAPGGVCPPIFQSAAARVGAGFGISWQTPLGLINIDLTPFVVKQKYDQTQVFRFGFGTRF